MRTQRTILAILIGAGSAMPALGQNRLGDGRGLERRLEITAPTQRVNPSEAWQRELAFRDAIVTGNAPGGLSFRGDTAYRSTREFAGELGSNDLFAFRRDSLYSGLSGHGLRATDALQYQMALTTGGRAPAGLIGSPVVYEAPVARAGGDTIRPRDFGVESGPIRADQEWIQNDLFAGGGSLMGTLRSPAAYVASRSSQPVLMQTSRDLADNPQGMTASSLSGLKMVPLVNRQALGPELAGAESMGPGGAALPRTSFDIVRDRLRAAATETPEVLVPEWETRLQELQAELDALLRAPAPVPVEREREGEAPAIEPVDPPAGYEGLEPATIEFIRRGRVSVDSFIGPVPEGEAAGAFVEHMQVGQQLLTSGRYFDAEERFTRALAARPDDSAAMIGRVHAQLGAGLLRSASANLREAISRRPEIVAIRYAGSTLPQAERLAELKFELSSNIGLGDEAWPRRLERESAFLLAYLGYQLGDEALTEKALAALGDSEAPADVAMLQLLRGVWLETPTDEGEGAGG